MGNEYYNSTLSDLRVPIIQTARVTSITDKTKSGRIFVALTGKDINNKRSNEKIPCISLLPKYFSVLPKVDDLVLIIQDNYTPSSPGTDSNGVRYWIGPLINQGKDLGGDPYDNALSSSPKGYTNLDADNSGKGAFGNPEDGDIILQGKDNTDIIQKNREIWIRAGKNETLENKDGKTTYIAFNSVDPGYIQLKYGKNQLNQDTEDFTQTTYIAQKPDFTFKVTIDTYDIDNEKLKGNLPPEYYQTDNILKTEIFITQYTYKDNKVIDTINDQTSYTGSASRENALKFIKGWIDGKKGNKWIIKSLSNDLIDIYKGADGVAIASMEPLKVEKKITRNVITKSEGKDDKNSVINLVANKINLLSHNGSHTFELTNPEKLITDEEQKKINNEAHPIAYGDTLVEFLELVKKYVSLHVHPYHGLPADPGKVTTDVLNFNLETILNKNINTN